MKTSEQINEIAAALSAFQSEVQDAPLDGVNPFFNNAKYATLTSNLSVIRPLLHKHGLSITQMPGSENGEHYVTTVLMHKSGQWMQSHLKLELTKKDMQGMGSAISYARRYMLSAFVGISDVDDDANSVSHDRRQLREPEKPKNAAPQLFMNEARIKALFAVTKQANWTEDQLRAFVKAQFGYDSVKSLKAQDFDLLLGHLKAKKGPVEEL